MSYAKTPNLTYFVWQELDFEDLRQPHIYQLLVTATEDSGGFSTSVELTIRYRYTHK